MTRWRYYRGTIGEPCEIDGVNIWAHDWHPLAGLKADIGNKAYQLVREIQVFAIPGPAKTIFFAAAEAANGCYDIYIPFVPAPIPETPDDPLVTRAKPDINAELSKMKNHDYDLPECAFEEVLRRWPLRKARADVEWTHNSAGEQPSI